MNIETVLKQLKDAGVYDTFGTKKEIKSLPEILYDDEVIQYATSGLVNGNTVLAVLTQKRLLFIDKGFFYGVRTTEIPLDMVNGVSYSKGLLLGEISVMNGTTSVKVGNVAKQTTDIMANAIKENAEKYKKQLHGYSAQAEGTVADELLKLKGLLDAGILSQEEFETQKAKILANQTKKDLALKLWSARVQGD